jgi:hypothetical protein
MDSGVGPDSLTLVLSACVIERAFASMARIAAVLDVCAVLARDGNSLVLSVRILLWIDGIPGPHPPLHGFDSLSCGGRTDTLSLSGAALASFSVQLSVKLGLGSAMHSFTSAWLRTLPSAPLRTRLVTDQCGSCTDLIIVACIPSRAVSPDDAAAPASRHIGRVAMR